MNAIALADAPFPWILAEGLTADRLREGFTFYLILVASLSVHEWAHAVTADKLGDPLPRAEGRVTLNPLSHIDPIGTVVLPLVMIFLNPGFAIFGWGKPVRISLPNPKTRIRDDLLITAAGPFSNLCIAFATACVAGLAIGLSGNFPMLDLASHVILVNCVLFLFNLMPVPPLDGSHFLKHAVRMKDETYAKLATYGFLILLVLINIPWFREGMRATLRAFASGFFWLTKGIAELLG